MSPAVSVAEGRTLEEAVAIAVAEQDVSVALAHLDSLPEIDARYRRIMRAVAEGRMDTLGSGWSPVLG